MSNLNKTHLSILLDRSGSMQSCWNDTIGNIDSFLESQRKEPGEMQVTLATFNTVYEVPFKNVNLQDVKSFTSVGRPQGGTALYDSFCRLVDDTGAYLASLPEAERPGKIIVVVLTDGEENSSKEFNIDLVKAKLKEQTEKYSWNFVFLGANFDANNLGSSVGLRRDASANYVKGEEGMAFQALTASVKSFRGKASWMMDDEDYGLMKNGIENK